LFWYNQFNNMLKRLLGITQEPQLIVYKSFGSLESFEITGKVCEKYKMVDREQTSIKENVLQLFCAYFAKPLSSQEVHILYRNKEVTTKTNNRGMFTVSFHVDAIDLDQDSEWIDVPVSLVKTGDTEVAQVLLEGRDNTFGIISDIDDTVLVTEVTHKIKLLILMIMKNAYTRTMFVGVSDFYKALVLGKEGTNSNPIFYVSSSHWNLYSFLNSFMKHNKLPEGPLLLKEFSGIRGFVKGMSDHTHKQKKIERILETYPDLPFILIGDSGQHDAELYSKIVSRYPQRILAIYIRDVTKHEDKLVIQAKEQLKDVVPLIEIVNTQEAIEDAQRRGFIAKKK